MVQPDFKQLDNLAKQEGNETESQDHQPTI